MSILVKGGENEGSTQGFLLILRAWSLLDILLWLVVLLGQVFCRGLAGDLDKGQLFVVAGHIARRLAHAEVVVSLHQEICSRQRSSFAKRLSDPKLSAVTFQHIGLLLPGRTKPFMLTESRVSTFFVQLGGAVGRIAWGARNTHGYMKFLHGLFFSTRHVGRVSLTGHVHHAAVAVVHQVPRLAVDATGSDAVTVEEVRIHGRGLAVSPGWRQINQLQRGQVTLGTTQAAWKRSLFHISTK